MTTRRGRPATLPAEVIVAVRAALARGVPVNTVAREWKVSRRYVRDLLAGERRPDARPEPPEIAALASVTLEAGADAEDVERATVTREALEPAGLIPAVEPHVWATCLKSVGKDGVSMANTTQRERIFVEGPGRGWMVPATGAALRFANFYRDGRFWVPEDLAVRADGDDNVRFDGRSAPTVADLHDRFHAEMRAAWRNNGDDPRGGK